jgi:hypothetical protein
MYNESSAAELCWLSVGRFRHVHNSRCGVQQLSAFSATCCAASCSRKLPLACSALLRSGPAGQQPPLELRPSAASAAPAAARLWMNPGWQAGQGPRSEHAMTGTDVGWSGLVCGECISLEVRWMPGPAQVWSAAACAYLALQKSVWRKWLRCARLSQLSCRGA